MCKKEDIKKKDPEEEDFEEVIMDSGDWNWEDDPDDVE